LANGSSDCRETRSCNERAGLIAAISTYPHPGDLDLIPFDQTARLDRGSFVLSAELSRHDGRLYGGTGAAAAVMAMEAATQRDAIWVLTQYVTPARVGERIHWVARTLSEGRYVAQLHVAATAGDRLVFCSLGATARGRPNGLDGQFEISPEVTPPDDSRPLTHGTPRPEGGRFYAHGNLELREATFSHPVGPGRLALWARLRPGRLLTRAGIAYLADRVPMAISRGAGRLAPGSSLDNCVRFAAIPRMEWVLFDLRGQVASAGYGHGSFTAWSPDGQLVAAGGQSATMTVV
jgi:acyl-CoA thioesterase